MLLKISLLTLVVVNIFIYDFKILAVIFCLLLAYNLFFNKTLGKQAKKLKLLFFIYLSTFIIQFFYNQEGRVLFKIYNIYITETGLISSLTSFLKLMNLIFISWIINDSKAFKFNYFKNYQKTIATVIELSPQVFVLFKKKMNIKLFLRHILKEIDKKVE